MQSQELSNLVQSALDNLKGLEIVAIDVMSLTSIADVMIVATGTSVRHVRALADEVRLRCKESGTTPIGVEGDSQSDWVLVDLGDVIVHIMTAEKRDFYALEKLWSVKPDGDAEAKSSKAMGLGEKTL